MLAKPDSWVPLGVEPTDHGVVRIIKRTGMTVELEAQPSGGGVLEFTLVRLMTPPPGMTGPMWSVNYGTSKTLSSPRNWVPHISHVFCARCGK
jgi:hypothetical protein